MISVDGHNRALEIVASLTVLATAVLNSGLISRRIFKPATPALPRLAAATAISSAVSTVMLTALAYTSLFYPATVLLTCLLCSAVVFILCRCPRPLQFVVPSFAPRDLLLIALTTAAALFAFHTGSEEFVSTRDPGVYSCTGVTLAKTGRLGWTDPLLPHVKPEVTRTFYEDMNDLMQGKPRWQFFPGFYLRDMNKGTVEPQFLHTFEPWIAVAYWISPKPASVSACVAAWGLLFLWVFAAFALQIAGHLPAFFAVLSMALCPAFLWYARTPSNELMSMVFLWSAVLLFTGNGLSLPPKARLLTALSLLLIGMCGKFSLWLYLPAFGFTAGILAKQRKLPLSFALPTVTVVPILATLYAGTCANWYSWGSAYVSALKDGWHLWQVLAFFPVCAAISVLIGYCFPIPSRLSFPRTFRTPAIIIALLLMTFAFFQQYLLTSFTASATDIDTDKWRNLFPVGQLGTYFGFLFPFAFAGLACAPFLIRGKKAAILLALILLCACALLFKSGIDAMHPWAVRRWLVALIPVFCLMLGYAALVVIKTVPRKFRMPAQVLITITIIAAMGTAAPAVSTTRQQKGLCETGDRLAQHLSQTDLVVAHPTFRVACLSSYLWSHHNVDMRPLQWNAFSWNIAVQAFRQLHNAGKRAFYVSDYNAFSPAEFPFMTQVATGIPFAWDVLEDGFMRPQTATTRTSGTYTVWQVDPDKIPYGWHFPVKWPTENIPPLPFSSVPETTPALALIDGGIPSDDPQYPGLWLNHTVRIHAGAYALPNCDAPTTAAGIRAKFRLSNGNRTGEVHLNCNAYLGLGTKFAKLYGVSFVGTNTTETVLSIPFKDIRPDSAITLESEVSKTRQVLPIEEHQGVLLEHLNLEYYE